MTDNDTVQGLRDYFSTTSEYNKLRFFVEAVIRDVINTAAIVRVDSCTAPGVSGPAGTVSATPLVAQTDAVGNMLPMSSIPRLPYVRYQAGCAAVVIDPVPGDQGLAVFCKNDSSGIGAGTDTPQPPGSYRSFSQSDGVYVPGTQNANPTVWIELTQNNTITIHAPDGVVIETDQNCTINAGQQINITAGESCTISAPTINLNGALTASSVDGGATVATVNGTLHATQDVTAQEISLHTHTHTGVEPGSGSTGGPQ